jgi:small subunit ribosomal protein S1
MDPMGAMLDDYMEPQGYRHGDIIEGIVVSAAPRSILIDVGGKSDAIVHPREVENMSGKELELLKPGSDVNVYVLDSGEADGTIVVSIARAAQQSDWDKARELMDDHKILDLDVVDINKGGVIVRMGRLRGFVPGSLLMPNWRPKEDTPNPNRRWQDLMGESLSLRIIEVTPDRNRLILSERGAARKASKREVLESLEIGSVQRGTVSNIVPFGAFVNVKGVDGLLHISELSWKRVDDPEEVVSVGQELDVYVLDVDLDKERLGLSLKKLQKDPWEAIVEEFEPGQIIDVEIVNLTSFGAFAAILDKPEIEGLIHISELSDHSLTHPGEVVEVGERHKVKIISLKPERRRIAFSLKAVADSELAEDDVE